MTTIISETHVKPKELQVGDWVVYKPYPNCELNSISGLGNVIEVIDDYTYKVTFGHRSIYGTRTGNYNYSNLYKTTQTK